MMLAKSQNGLTPYWRVTVVDGFAHFSWARNGVQDVKLSRQLSEMELNHLDLLASDELSTLISTSRDVRSSGNTILRPIVKHF